jgi:hypothetical protein
MPAPLLKSSLKQAIIELRVLPYQGWPFDGNPACDWIPDWEERGKGE